MTTYLALLRGINVGGKAMIKMADLKTALEAAGLSDVRTYIQSGNVLFSAETADTDELVAKIAGVIQSSFGLQVDVVVFTKAAWQAIIAAAPKWWGVEKTWKHNLWVMIKPYDTQEVKAAIGQLKPEIEKMVFGTDVLYQSMSFEKFGQTTTGKIISSPVYKNMTIRNFNTATKLAALLS